MSVVPSLIVLVITALLVFRYELTHLAAPASKPTPAPRRRPLRQSKASQQFGRGGRDPHQARESSVVHFVPGLQGLVNLDFDGELTGFSLDEAEIILDEARKRPRRRRSEN